MQSEPGRHRLESRGFPSVDLLSLASSGEVAIPSDPELASQTADPIE